jgi:hypothetical protein
MKGGTPTLLYPVCPGNKNVFTKKIVAQAGAAGVGAACATVWRPAGSAGSGRTARFQPVPMKRRILMLRSRPMPAMVVSREEPP